jgi:hypothetical protein
MGKYDERGATVLFYSPGQEEVPASDGIPYTYTGKVAGRKWGRGRR